MKRVKLDYKPVAARKSSEIAFTVSGAHVCAVDRSIARKVAKNESEKRASREFASKYVVG